MVLPVLNPAIEIVILGKPFPWRRTRGMGKRRFQDPEQAAYKTFAQYAMIQALRGQPRPLFPTGPVEIFVRAVWGPTGKRPVRSSRLARVKATRPDGDNVSKLLQDCSEGFLVADDGQYARIVIEKWYAAENEDPHVLLRVRRMGE